MTRAVGLAIHGARIRTVSWRVINGFSEYDYYWVRESVTSNYRPA